MNVKISNANSIQELCDQFRTIFPNNKIKGNKILVSHNGNTFHIKRIEGMDNTFEVSLPLPVGLNILGTIVGVVIAFVTGFSGFIGIFACVGITLFVINVIRKIANNTKLTNFISLFGGNTKEIEGFSNKEDSVNAFKGSMEYRYLENLKEKVIVSKQRNVFVTSYLLLMIIGNFIIGVRYVLATHSIGNVSKTILVLLGIFSFVNYIFSILIFEGKKIGFWGIIGTSIVALIINLSNGLGIGLSLLGLVSTAILYGILQIKKDNSTAWENLE